MIPLVLAFVAGVVVGAVLAVGVVVLSAFCAADVEQLRARRPSR